MTITELSDEALFTTCVDAIWRAAAGESRGGDDPTYNRAMDLLAESQRRHTAAGHDEKCQGSIYQRAFEQATAEHAYRTPNLPECTCGAGR